MYLKEQIGIDRSVVCGFVLLSIDSNKIEEQSKNNKNNYINLIEDKTSPIELEDGKRIGKLLIKDKKIGQLCVSLEKNNIKKTYYVNSSLELILHNNLQNLTAEEYKARVVEAFCYLENKYGVRVDYSNLEIKKIEVNATFYLDEPFDKYKQAILLIMQNVPPSTFGNNKAIKYATWHECNAQKDTLETAVVKNSSFELKIYNKGKQLKDTGEIKEELDKDIMRVEFAIKDRRLLKTHFKNYFVFELSDEKLNNLFTTYFEKNIVDQYSQWREKNHKELLTMVKKHQLEKTHWVDNFLRECRQYAAEQGLPILFSLEDMQDVFKALDKNRNASKKFESFKEKATYESDLSGNTRRIEEIINKGCKLCVCKGTHKKSLKTKKNA